MNMAVKLNALWRMVTRSVKRSAGKKLLNLSLQTRRIETKADMEEEIKKAKELVDNLDISKFKSQCGTTWEVHLEDGSLYQRGNFTACFAGTVSSLKKCLNEGKTPKTVTYFVEDRKQKENLTREERIDWFELLKKYNVISSEEEAEKLIDEGITFDLSDESLTPCSLYLELALCRYINEEPAVVRSVFLLTEAGLGFAQALAYAQAKHGKSPGHMVLPYTGGIYAQNIAAADAGKALSLSNFIKDRTKMDNRQVVAEIKDKGYGIWKFHAKLSETNNEIKLGSIDNFLSEEMAGLFNCDNEKDMEALVKESKKKGSSIFV